MEQHHYDPQTPEQAKTFADLLLEGQGHAIFNRPTPPDHKELFEALQDHPNVLFDLTKTILAAHQGGQIKIAGPWEEGRRDPVSGTPLVGITVRCDLLGVFVARTFNYTGRKKWAVDGTQPEDRAHGSVETVADAQAEADHHLQKIGWTLL